ncbi:hypothetical protein XENORESO_012555 [Xenotaenia resolanae]|uniref:Uncharacterized protein n=1 Tax=Xenotaenia resolanae TaxID=208358 RepID=A0ABV0WUA2_9TELE
MRVRAGGVPPSCSRTVKQAQAAERAGRAANRLRGAQRERQNFSAYGKNPACRSLFLIICLSESSYCGLWCFLFLLSFSPCVPYEADARRAAEGKQCDKRCNRFYDIKSKKGLEMF